LTIILNDDDQVVVDALELLDRVRRRRSVLLSYRIESVEPGLNVSNAWSTSSRVSVAFPTEGDTAPAGGSLGRQGQGGVSPRASGYIVWLS
jgi:hypothetical protein